MAPLLLGAAATAEAYTFQVSHHVKNVRGLTEPLTVAFLTDLHLGPYMGLKRMGAWVAASNALSPDLVLLGGDLVDQFYTGDISEAVPHLAALQSRLGTFAVLGNHDRTRYRDLSPLLAAFRAAGVSVLMNEGVRVRPDLWVAGIDDWRTGHPDVGSALRRAPPLHEGARLLLTHNPDAIPDLPTDLDLVLAGHTHGGQVQLPLIGPLVTSSEYGRRFAEGWVDAPMPAFVSRGLGVTLLPFRLLCRAEVVSLELIPT